MDIDQLVNSSASSPDDLANPLPPFLAGALKAQSAR